MDFKKIFQESNNQLFNKITPKYIKNIFVKQYHPINGKEYCDWDYYNDMFEGERFEMFLKEFDEFLDKIEVEDNNLILYRGLYLSSPDKLIKQDKKGNSYFGICWTINEDLFENTVALCAAKKVNTVLKAKVPIEGVNWKDTILNYYYNSFMKRWSTTPSPKELEIRLKKNSPVELLDVYEL